MNMQAFSTNNAAQTLAAAENLPAEWRYTPVKGKAPGRKNWTEDHFTKEAVIAELSSVQKWTGIGAMCGVPSGGMLFLDHDGASCDPLIEQLSGQSLTNALPDTVTVTSGKLGRYQAIYRIPEEYWNAISTKKQGTGVTGPDGKEEGLEFRWNGCQSVVCGIHPDTQKPYHWVNPPETTPIAEAPLWMIEQMLKDKSTQKTASKAVSKPVKHLTAQVTGDIPLTKCLSKAHRDLINSGMGEGGRDNAGASLARDLIGTEQHLRSIGQKFEEDVRSLFEDYCSRCSPPLDDKDCDRIWNSAEKSNPTPCLDTDKIQACIAAHYGVKRSSQGFGDKVVSIATGQPIVPIDGLDSEIEKLLDLNLTAPKLQTAKIRLRQSSSLAEREFNDLWKVVEQNYEQGTECDPEEIHRLLRSKQSTLSLSQIVHPTFAKTLSEQAKMMNLREEVYLTALLTVTGSLAQNETRLLLSRATDYEVTPNLYSAIVAPPSQKKSPVISAIVTKPLRVLKKQAKDRWLQALEEWEKRKKEAQENGEEFHEKQPQQEVFYFTKASGESILAQADRVPHRGLLNLSDELAGTFKSKNQYRGGRGSDGEDMLSFYDGIGGTTLRVDGVRNDVGYLNYGVLGGIQPGVLKGFLGKCEDSNGNWARYIFVNQPIAASTLPEDNDDVRSVSEMLAMYYGGIADFEPQQYELSRPAYQKFRELYNDYEQRRVNEPNPALQAALGKSAGRVGKVALCLHLLEASATCRTVPELEVSESTIEKAALVAEFAIEQLRALYGDADTEAGSSPMMARIVELSQRKGEISARDVIQASSKINRPNSSQVKQMFAELEKEGFGTVIGAGRSAKFTAFSEQVKPAESEQEVTTVVPIEPEIETDDRVILVSDGYAVQGFNQGDELQVIRIDLSAEQNMRFATVMKTDGSTIPVWLCHLERSRSSVSPSNHSQGQEVA